MDNDSPKWFVSERAKALAGMHLTRRDDLLVTEPDQDVGLMYLVYIKKEAEKPSVRSFGVALLATPGPSTEERLNKIIRPKLRPLLQLGEYPYPVCLFYFTVKDGRGYYTWVAEPFVTEEGKPKLQMRSDPDCKKLDREALDDIVRRVDKWYDALFADILLGAAP